MNVMDVGINLDIRGIPLIYGGNPADVPMSDPTRSQTGHTS